MTEAAATDGFSELVLILTTACNLGCSYCYQRAKSPGSLKQPLLFRALDLLIASSGDRLAVSFTGGEPTLEFPVIVEAIEYMRRREASGRTTRYSLVTNGVSLSEETLSVLDANDVHVTVSCDGVAPAQSIRGLGSFERLDRLFDLLSGGFQRYCRDRVGVAMTLTPAALPYLSESVAYFLRKGIRSITVSVAMGAVNWRPRDLEILERQWSRVFRLSLDHYHYTGAVPLTNLRKRGSKAAPRRPLWGCSAPKGNTLAVDVDGQVYPCVLAARSYQRFSTHLDVRTRELSLGDVRAPGFPSRLAALQDASRRSGLFDPQRLQHSGDRMCATCSYRSDCFVCPIARAHGPSADVNDVPACLCAFNRTVAKYRRRFPVQPTPEQTIRRILERIRPTAEALRRPD